MRRGRHENDGGRCASRATWTDKRESDCFSERCVGRQIGRSVSATRARAVFTNDVDPSKLLSSFPFSPFLPSKTMTSRINLNRNAPAPTPYQPSVGSSSLGGGGGPAGGHRRSQSHIQGLATSFGIDDSQLEGVKQVTSKIEDAIENLTHPIKPYLPAMARCVPFCCFLRATRARDGEGRKTAVTCMALEPNGSSVCLEGLKLQSSRLQGEGSSPEQATMLEKSGAVLLFCRARRAESSSCFSRPVPVAPSSWHTLHFKPFRLLLSGSSSSPPSSKTLSESSPNSATSSGTSSRASFSKPSQPFARGGLLMSWRLTRAVGPLLSYDNSQATKVPLGYLASVPVH